MTNDTNNAIIDPVELEKAALEKEKESKTQLDMELEACAALLQTYTPVFKDRLKKLSNKQLRRLMGNLVTFPLNEKAYSPSERYEKDALLIGAKLVEATSMLKIYTAQEAIQAQQKDIVELEQQADQQIQNKEEAKLAIEKQNETLTSDNNH